MFTDIVGSTEMTARLGDRRAVEIVRAHDALVRRALAGHQGREVKHTGDGIMASFADTAAAVASARAILEAFADFNRSSAEPIRVRIGLHAGEPVEDSNDLFGATVQMAARLCQAAEPDTIVTSSEIRAACADDTSWIALGESRLKGFPAPVPLFRVAARQRPVSLRRRTNAKKFDRACCEGAWTFLNWMECIRGPVLHDLAHEAPDREQSLQQPSPKQLQVGRREVGVPPPGQHADRNSTLPAEQHRGGDPYRPGLHADCGTRT